MYSYVYTHMYHIKIMWNYWKVKYLAIHFKMQLVRFLIGGFEYCMERNPCLQPKWHTFNLAIFM